MRYFIKKHQFLIISILTISCVFIILLFANKNRLGAFGCFDDCNNYMRGYFLTKGRTLFSEIFTGHMPLMGYISYAIQSLFRPESTYHLLLYHRLFLIIYSLAWWIFLVIRLRWPALGFIIFYELYSMYLFGDRFLAEGMIVYPIVYMASLVWFTVEKKRVYVAEYFFVALLTWYVIFMREPYGPVALFLFAAILWGKKMLKQKIVAATFFIVLSFTFILLHPVDEFIFQVFTLNKINIATHLEISGTKGFGIIKNVLYPFIVYIQGYWNIIRIIFIVFVTCFFILLLPLIRAKKITHIVLLFTILSLANLRYTTPGTAYYAAHHILNWYALLVIFVFHLLASTTTYLKKPVLLILGAVFVVTFFSSKNDIWLRINTLSEIHDGFATYSIAGRIFKTLAVDSNAKLFVDGGDDLVYWKSGLDSPYKYAWYTSLMPYHKPYRDARIEMFQKYPPDFYYGNCRPEYRLPNFIEGSYINIRSLTLDKSCLYVHKEYLKRITDEKKKDISTLGYTL